jgi:uncharacterized membrane protein
MPWKRSQPALKEKMFNSEAYSQLKEIYTRDDVTRATRRGKKMTSVVHPLWIGTVSAILGTIIGGLIVAYMTGVFTQHVAPHSNTSTVHQKGGH